MVIRFAGKPIIVPALISASSSSAVSSAAQKAKAVPDPSSLNQTRHEQLG